MERNEWLSMILLDGDRKIIDWGVYCNKRAECLFLSFVRIKSVYVVLRNGNFENMKYT